MAANSSFRATVEIADQAADWESKIGLALESRARSGLSGSRHALAKRIDR
jgi:hypothetical protein